MFESDLSPLDEEVRVRCRNHLVYFNHLIVRENLVHIIYYRYNILLYINDDETIRKGILDSVICNNIFNYLFTVPTLY